MRPRHLIEYIGARALLRILDRLSLDRAERLACCLADLWYVLHVTRRRVACANILQSGIAENAARAATIARKSFRHFAVLIVESLKCGDFLSQDNWRDRVEIDIEPETDALLKKPGQGLIMVSGHFGNWEVAAQLLSYIKPVVGITRDFNNPYMDRLMKERKPRNRFRLTPKHDAGAGRFLSSLRKGEILALMIDQHAKHRGMMLDFFGRPASTYASAALLHLITGTPLCFGYCLRTGRMRYMLKASAPLVLTPTGKRDNDVREILTKLNHELEKAIRLSPEQYLWAHRRWKQRTPQQK